MDVKEKLVELLQDENNPVCRWFPNNMAMMQLADYLISNVVTVKEWISVNDRLPEDGDIVLCYMEFGEQRIARWYESENCWAGQLIDYHKEQVTHWMPLPQPPKGE